MQTGKYIFNFPQIKEENLRSTSNGIDFNSITRLIGYLREVTASRKTALIIFVHPDMKKISTQINVTPKNLYLSLIYLSSHYPEMVKFQSYFQLDADELFEQIHEEDKELLELKNIYRNPNRPEIFYKDADSHIRLVFNIGKKS